MERDEPFHHLPLARRDAGHVHVHLAGRHTKANLWIDERDGFRTVNDILAGQASDVWARATDHFAFDDGRFFAALGERPSHELPADAASNHNISILFDSHGESPDGGSLRAPIPCIIIYEAAATSS